MSLRMVRARIQAGKTEEMEQAVKEMFAAIDAAQPAGVRYASCRLPDGVTYVVLLQLDDDASNPLAAVPVFNEVQAKIQSWLDGPPAVEELTPVGSYRLF